MRDNVLTTYQVRSGSPMSTSLPMINCLGERGLIKALFPIYLLVIVVRENNIIGFSRHIPIYIGMCREKPTYQNKTTLKAFC